MITYRLRHVLAIVFGIGDAIFTRYTFCETRRQILDNYDYWYDQKCRRELKEMLG